MARAAQADGIAAICATPHIRHDHDVRIGELPARRAELEAAVAHDGCSTRILPGGEVAASAVTGLDDDELAAVSLGGGGRWILLEPSPGPLDDALDGVVEELAGRSFRVLIAHPERHPAPDLVQRLQRLIAGGALVQATAAFLTDETVQRGMTALARERVLHVLGSDSHSSRVGRPAALTPALDVLRSVQPTAAHLDWIARAAPIAIIRGEEVRAPF
jgi:protein-tyrosine phosphatase